MKQTRPVSSLISVAMLVALAGCSVGPDYKTPQAEAPITFSSLKEADDPQLASKPSGTESLTTDALATWWQGFEDPELNSLIDRAVAANYDLKIAAARVREARALRGVTASAQYPDVNASGSAYRTRTSANLASSPPNGGTTSNLFQVGLDASYEIDVFGGVRRSIEAADADVGAAVESHRDVLITVLAEVAQSYIDLRGFQQRVQLSQRVIAASQETVDLTSSRFRAGLAADLEVAQAQAQLATRQAVLPALRTGERASAHRLAILLGQQPGALLDELDAAGTIPKTPSEIPVGLPSDLLQRRPDIRQSERALAAATARIGVATSDLYPKFSLTGFYDLQSSKSDKLFDLSSSAWSIGPSVRWNIFSGGRVRSEIAAADARSEQALYAYDQLLLVAFGEVEDALTSFVQEQAQRTALSAAVDANTRAVALSTDRYRSGVGDFLNVLDTQRDLYVTQDQLVQSEANVTRDLIALYKALGGGWSEQEAQEERPKDQDTAPKG